MIALDRTENRSRTDIAKSEIVLGRILLFSRSSLHMLAIPYSVNTPILHGTIRVTESQVGRSLDRGPGGELSHVDAEHQLAKKIGRNGDGDDSEKV
jgi:hypothetical protein